MAKFQFINHFSATLSSAIGETDTTLSWSSATADAFTIEDGGYVPLTLLNPASPGSYEVVYATSITSTTLVVLRGKEGSAASWAAGSTIVCAPTASVLGLSSLAGSQHLWSQSTASLIGGYQKYALVVGTDGNLWQSTADDNVSTPGADGASWELLFNGYATEEWANGQFLQLDNTEKQTVTGPVAFSGATAVPDITEFDGEDALNAETAEGRYVKSIPVSPNKRITDIWENADGRLVFGDGTAAPVVANLSDLPTQFNGVDSSGRAYGYQKFNDGTMIVFGYAYYPKSAGAPGTIITLPFSFPGKFIGLNCTDVGNDNNAVAAYPESQSSFRCWAGAPTISYLNTWFYYTARGTWK